MTQLETEYLTVSKAARYADTTEAAIRSRMQRGLLPSTTVFGCQGGG